MGVVLAAVQHTTKTVRLMSEVMYLQIVVSVEQQILRFQVTMDDRVEMAILHAGHYLVEEMARLVRYEPPLHTVWARCGHGVGECTGVQAASWRGGEHLVKYEVERWEGGEVVEWWGGADACALCTDVESLPRLTYHTTPH